MLFSSITFIFYFLPAFLFLYWLTGIRNSILLIGSSFFYVWGEGAYIFLLIGLLAFNQIAGIIIEKSEKNRRLAWLSFFVLANFSVLGFFKYGQFLLDIYFSISGAATYKLESHLPLGISFFIFQLVSYLVEVYRKSISAERDFIKLATYIMMFPHLIAGPIVRYTDIMHELKSRSINVGMIGLGVQFFIVGLSQKVLIANTLASVVDHVFALPADSLGLVNSWLGVFAYTLQIYFDFCGYSNMAIGLALMMGFHFPKNFDYPYSSRSISEFWRRWHMSLSFWFRDYLYIPLGGSKSSVFKTVRNLAIVFLLTGLWHGAAWTFIFWGAFHGFFVIIERLFLGKILKRTPDVIARIYTLLVIMIAWVFFRAETFDHAASILKAMFGLGNNVKHWDPLMTWVTPEIILAFLIGSILSFPVIPHLLNYFNIARVPGPGLPGRSHFERDEVHVIPNVFLIVGFILSVVFLSSNSLNPFLYFRF